MTKPEERQHEAAKVLAIILGVFFFLFALSIAFRLAPHAGVAGYDPSDISIGMGD
jgi:hypothetical protein